MVEGYLVGCVPQESHDVGRSVAKVPQITRVDLENERRVTTGEDARHPTEYQELGALDVDLDQRSRAGGKLEYSVAPPNRNLNAGRSRFGAWPC